MECPGKVDIKKAPDNRDIGTYMPIAGSLWIKNWW
jgi:hypothetical protein